MKKDNRREIDTMDVKSLLDKYHQKYELQDRNRIKLIDKEDGSFTMIDMADDKKSVTYEGMVIGGLDELEEYL